MVPMMVIPCKYVLEYQQIVMFSNRLSLAMIILSMVTVTPFYRENADIVDHDNHDF